MELMRCLPYWLGGTSCSTDEFLQSSPASIIDPVSNEAFLPETQGECLLHSAANIFARTCPISLPDDWGHQILSPTISPPERITVSPKVSYPAIVFSTDTLLSPKLLVAMTEAYGLQNQLTFCEPAEDSPQLGDVVTLWSKLVDVGVEWCCTSGAGCDVVAEYKSAEVSLCARRELCVRCFHISFGIGRLMRSCENNNWVQGSLGTRETLGRDGFPVIRITPRSRLYLGAR